MWAAASQLSAEWPPAGGDGDSNAAVAEGHSLIEGWSAVDEACIGFV